ncbi:hypothetical protein K4K48_000281 [Colletotrichum sp. SAR 10_66]|nr:hypothetical protein K4K48_000281 [Colletotrichum sp. SAR 10_66]
MSRHYQKWTPEIDQQILAAMVKVMIPTAEQYNAIMEELEPCGYGFTAITMKQHLQKLQKKEATVAADNGEGNGASAASTPKAKKTATPRKRKTPSKKAKTEEDDDEEEEKPAKKPKAPPRPDFKEVNEAEAAEELADWQSVKAEI